MDDLRRRLARLGVTKGDKFEFKKPAPSGPDIDKLLEGAEVEAADQSCFMVKHRYASDTTHGTLSLGSWHVLDVWALSHIGDDSFLTDVEPGSYVFLDTETTGLGGGAIAFLVGIGLFLPDGDFEIRQYFLRSPSEEPAMLHQLKKDISENAALVTFNGRTFDVPLLAGRYVMNRQTSLLAGLPHLDLLHPARRLWRRRLDSCALSALEPAVLGVHRTEQDVPGSMIPYLYRRYLETRDAHDMVRVLYHNEIDLLSMVVLGVSLGRAFEQPDAPGLPIDDRLSLARWYQQQAMLSEAEVAYRVAAEEAPDAVSRYDALVGLAYLLKRSERRSEAVPHWEDVADLKLDTLGHEELAKFYEWYGHELPQALAWTDAAIALAQTWRPGWRQTETLSVFNHRRERLLRKLSREE